MIIARWLRNLTNHLSDSGDWSILGFRKMGMARKRRKVALSIPGQVERFEPRVLLSNIPLVAPTSDDSGVAAQAWMAAVAGQPGDSIAEFFSSATFGCALADPSGSPRVRYQIRSRIQRIFDNADEVRSGVFRGQGPNGTEGPVLFFRRGHDVVVTTPNGDFVTLLTGGINNQRFINGVPLP